MATWRRTLEKQYETKRAENFGPKHVEQEVVNSKCTTFREGEISVYFANKTYFDFFNCTPS